MRHRVHGRKLGRTTAHRKALFRNQLSALFVHERIVTTLAKAKELRPIAEKLVTLARTGTLPARRKVLTMVPNKETVTRLFDEIAPRFMDRDGGYTRIMRLGRRRGDGAELAIIEFVDYVPEEKGESEGSKKGSFMDRAKGVFGGGSKAAESEKETTEAPQTVEAEEVEAAAAEKPKKKPAKKTKKAEEPEADAAPAEEKPKKKATKKAAKAKEPEAEAAEPSGAPAEPETEPAADEAKAEEPADEEKKDE